MTKISRAFCEGRHCRELLQQKDRANSNGSFFGVEADDPIAMLFSL
jgi:hypothetical protein